jgi:xylulokinase
MGIAVTSTSGSLVLADGQGEPLRAAILYDDVRGQAAAEDLNRRLSEAQDQINSSYSLAKALWVRQQEPALWERARYLLHPADWLTGKLTGQFGIADYSNALKLGYDQEREDWTAAVGVADIPREMLPKVVRPGQQVGAVSAKAGEDTGLAAGLPVLAGATDGLASLVASGATNAGHANTTLGTTLVWKALSRTKPRLSAGMYCHHHPSDLWAPGAASNTGPSCLRPDDPALDPAKLDRRAAPHLPASVQCYLLGSRGERFPFLNRDAVSFVEGTAASPGESYAAQLQSLACVERWGYERLEACGVTIGDEVFSAGSAAASPVLSQLRANLLGRAVIRCQQPTASFGAAILAAGEVLYGGDLTAAMRSMTRVCASYQPKPGACEKYERAYRLFRGACTARGYV